MAYTLDRALILGALKAGLTDLRAQLVDVNGADVGAAISTTFAEIGTGVGLYHWSYTVPTTTTERGVKFYSNAAPTVILTSDAFNPVTEAANAVLFPTGAIEFTYTVTNSVGGAPIDGVEVWISTDLAGTNVIWAGATDALGVARDVNDGKPMLDAGTYYFWRQLAGWTFVNPDTEVVS
jgi:hypothetical protein